MPQSSDPANYICNPITLTLMAMSRSMGTETQLTASSKIAEWYKEY